MSNTMFAAVDEQNLVWGLGATEELALLDARQFLAELPQSARDEPRELHTIEVSAELGKRIKRALDRVTDLN